MTVLYVPMINAGAATRFDPSKVSHVWTDGLGDCILVVAVLGGKAAALHYSSQHPSGSGAVKTALGSETAVRADRGVVLTNFCQPTKGGMGADSAMPSTHALRTRRMGETVGLQPVVVETGRNSSFIYRLADNSIHLVADLPPGATLTEAEVEASIAAGRDVTADGGYDECARKSGAQKKTRKWYQFWK